MSVHDIDYRMRTIINDYHHPKTCIFFLKPTETKITCTIMFRMNEKKHMIIFFLKTMRKIYLILYVNEYMKVLCIIINGEGGKRNDLLTRENNLTEFRLKRSTTNLEIIKRKLI